MALRLTDLSTSNVALLNRWAADNDNRHDETAKQLTQIHTMLQKLFDKNPTLVKPG